VARITFLDNFPAGDIEEETPEQKLRLAGYLINCPACDVEERHRNPPASVRAEVTAILTEALRRSA
jgi:hypothetical protein